MSLSSSVRVWPLMSGTTNFFSGSILHADELSITVIPASANTGASAREVPPPAENKATAGFIAIASAALTTLYFFPLNSTSLPTLFSEATGINWSTGKSRSASTRSEEHTSELQSLMRISYAVFYLKKKKKKQKN